MDVKAIIQGVYDYAKVSTGHIGMLGSTVCTIRSLALGVDLIGRGVLLIRNHEKVKEVMNEPTWCNKLHKKGIEYGICSPKEGEGEKEWKTLAMQVITLLACSAMIRLGVRYLQLLPSSSRWYNTTIVPLQFDCDHMKALWCSAKKMLEQGSDDA